MSAIGQVGDVRSAQSLIGAPGDSNAGVCEAPARPLGRFGDAGAIEPLRHAIQRTGHLGVRGSAVRSRVQSRGREARNNGRDRSSPVLLPAPPLGRAEQSGE